MVERDQGIIILVMRVFGITQFQAIMNAAGSNKTSSIDFLSARMQEKYGESRKNQLLQWVINVPKIF